MKIAVIPGDGTGPEVTNEALKVLKAVSEQDGYDYELTHYDFGGDRYLQGLYQPKVFPRLDKE